MQPWLPLCLYFSSSSSCLSWDALPGKTASLSPSLSISLGVISPFSRRCGRDALACPSECFVSFPPFMLLEGRVFCLYPHPSPRALAAWHSVNLTAFNWSHWRSREVGWRRWRFPSWMLNGPGTSQGTQAGSCSSSLCRSAPFPCPPSSHSSLSWRTQLK